MVVTALLQVSSGIYCPKGKKKLETDVLGLSRLKDMLT